jgi:hypothetical protein
MRNIITMLTFEKFPKEIQEMKDTVNRNIFFGILFIKADNSLRPLNGRKVKYVSQARSGETRGVWDRKEHNIITFFDRNKQQEDRDHNLMFYTDENGKKKPLMNAPRGVRLDRLLFFKAGNLVYDFTQVNVEAIKAAKITPQQLDAEKERMKISFSGIEAKTPLEVVDPATLTTNPEGTESTSPEEQIQEIVVNEIKRMFKNIK